MSQPITIPEPPAPVIEAAAAVTSIRQAIERQKQTAADAKTARAAADAEHIRASADAAIKGGAPLKVPASRRTAREEEETADGVLANLEERLRAAEGAHMDAVYSWGRELVTDQIADDVKTGREALAAFTKAYRLLVDSLGQHGEYLAGEVMGAIPQTERFARVERLSAHNGIFASAGRRNPATEVGDGMLIEAGCPNGQEARELAGAE